MDNHERLIALDVARTNAHAWAEQAQREYPQNSRNSPYLEQQIAIACMWAQVAQALKTGDARADSPDH